MNQPIPITWNQIDLIFDCHIVHDQGDRHTPTSGEFAIEGIHSDTHPDLAEWLFEHIEKPLFIDLRSAVESKAFSPE